MLCIYCGCSFVHLLSFLDDTVRAEPVLIGSRCSSGVALLPCASKLMQQGTALTETLNLNLTWRRNGEELTPDSYSDLELVSHQTCLRLSLKIEFCGSG